ncbi:MAG: hypothetical protein RMX96_16375 [Nostoc sp. ChiSLP02]|nr:hypothetical protein [Nostoc sp. DedSLP05]MDZ8100520.1 hypothetical protein [Nostoc sp. DedSLP01]MDZ8186413.1 hypothetical protein [Nostoc sp. ChiSLP02]
MIPNYDYAALHFAISMGGMRSPADTMKLSCRKAQRTTSIYMYRKNKRYYRTYASLPQTLYS